MENIAKQLGTRPARVSKWRQRFAKDRLTALSDAPRSGMPQKYTAGGVLVQYPEPVGIARREFHLGAATARSNRRIREGIQRQGYAFRMDQGGRPTEFAQASLLRFMQVSTRAESDRVGPGASVTDSRQAAEDRRTGASHGPHNLDLNGLQLSMAERVSASLDEPAMLARA